VKPQKKKKKKMMKKTKKKDSRSPGRDMNQRPPEYEAGVLSTRP
jgi:hypothetical protein